MIFIKELVRLFQIAQIPAEVQIVAVNIRNLQDRAVRFQHEHVRHRGEAGAIHAVAQVIEQPMVFQQVLIHRAGGVGQSPHGNTRMIVTLGDQLPHLGQRVFPAILHVLSDIGDLCPHHNAVLVAQIIEFLSVLVMRQPQSVGTQLPDDGHIRRMILPGQRVALSLPVLVTADAPQRIAAAIEEEGGRSLSGDRIETPGSRSGQ